ncbi:hypothetical protein ACS0TY_016455 [Phlomoides rotata]
MNISLSSLIHHRKTINHFTVSCNTNSSPLRFCSAWGSKCAVAGKKKDDIAFIHGCRRWGINTRQALNRLPTPCNSKLSDDEKGILKRKKAEDRMRNMFLEVYHSVLKPELLDDPSFEWTSDSSQWVQQMLDYNVPRGKLMRGLSVIDIYMILKEGEMLSADELFDSSIVGWCIEWLQAALLVEDDIMDNSHTRRGQACWFRVTKVGKIAVFNGIILFNHISRILKKHFKKKPFRVDLLDLFNEVAFQTASGQMLDLISTTGEEKDLSNYSLHHYRHIALYKTGYYTFYLPVACALLMVGEDLEKHVNVKDVLLDIGIYFQVVDDYLDCFGDPEKTGKTGTDIEDFKCSWLIVKALERANEEQKKILYEHYGKANPNDVAKVKDVYNDINLQGVFAAYESESYEKLERRVEAHPSKAVQAIWERYVKGISNYKQWL